MRITKQQLEILVKEALRPETLTHHELEEAIQILPAIGAALRTAGQVAGKAASAAARATSKAISKTAKNAAKSMASGDSAESAEEVDMDAKLRKAGEESDRAMKALGL